MKNNVEVEAISEMDKVLEKIWPVLCHAFSNIPEYGSLGITVHFNEKEQVRVETFGSESIRLLPKMERGQK